MDSWRSCRALETRLGGISANHDAADPADATDTVLVDVPDPTSAPLWIVFGVLGSGLGGAGWLAIRNQRNKAIRRSRATRVDDILGRLDVGGHELPHLGDFTVQAQSANGSVSTAVGLEALAEIADGSTDASGDVLRSLWSSGEIAVIDLDSLAQATEKPLELRVSGEEEVLEESVQASARGALTISVSDRQLFAVKLGELERLVDALRPHRVAEARRRAGENVISATALTPIGSAMLTERGERLLRAGPALDATVQLESSIATMDQAYDTAVAKTERLGTIYDSLPESVARPAVAAALADVERDPTRAVARYEAVRVELERLGSRLVKDNLAIEAIAAPLVDEQQ